VAAIAAIIFWGLPALGALVAGGAKPAVVAIMAGLGLTVLTTSATAGGDLCKAIPIPRLGLPDGFRSGLCADELGNVYPGQDICVSGVAFDALTAPSTLWEVKVIDFSNSKEFIIESQIVNKDIPQFERQKSAISQCPQYLHGWAVADPRHFLLQKVPYGWDARVNFHVSVSHCLLLPKSQVSE
jgi:hypothetical protein